MPNKSQLRASYRVRRELVALGVARERIKPNGSLHALLPRENRGALWHQLNSALSVEPAPLERSEKVRSLLFFGGTATLLSALIAPLYPPLGLAGICGAGATRLLSVFSTPHKVFPPRNARLVADLTRRVAWALPLALDEWPARDVWSQLQLIIADELGIAPEKVGRDADFFQDLGMG